MEKDNSGAWWRAEILSIRPSNNAFLNTPQTWFIAYDCEMDSLHLICKLACSVQGQVEDEWSRCLQAFLVLRSGRWDRSGAVEAWGDADVFG